MGFHFTSNKCFVKLLIKILGYLHLFMEGIKHTLMNNAQWKKWLTMFSCLVFVTMFDYFDLVHMLNKNQDHSFLVFECMLLVGIFFLMKEMLGSNST
jgi:uncharacterized membrane protein